MEAFSDKRVLTREQIRSAACISDDGTILNNFLALCLDADIFVKVGDAYTLYPHASGLFGPFYGERIAANRETKQRVAQYILDTMDFACGAGVCRGLAEVVAAHQTHPLIVDAGTSTQAVVRCLKEQLLQGAGSTGNQLQVYTVNLHSAMTLVNSPAEVFLPRGTIDHRFAALVGEDTANDVRVSFPRTGVALLATSTINQEYGLTSEDDAEIPVKREIVAKLPGTTLIVVADHTKVGHVGQGLFANLTGRHRGLRDRFEEHAYVVIDELPPGTVEPLKGHYLEALTYLIEHFHSPDAVENRLKMIDTRGRPIAAADIPARVEKCTG